MFKNYDVVQLEIRVVQLLYFYFGVMKLFSVFFGCSKYVELLLILKVLVENGYNLDCVSFLVVYEDVEM